MSDDLTHPIPWSDPLDPWTHPMSDDLTYPLHEASSSHASSAVPQPVAEAVFVRLLLLLLLLELLRAVWALGCRVHRGC